MGDSQDQSLSKLSLRQPENSMGLCPAQPPSSGRCTARGCGAQDSSALASAMASSKALSLSEPQLSSL